MEIGFVATAVGISRSCDNILVGLIIYKEITVFLPILLLLLLIVLIHLLIVFHWYYLLIDMLRRSLWYSMPTIIIQTLHILLELFGAKLWTFSTLCDITPMVRSWRSFLHSLKFFLVVLDIAHLDIFAKVWMLSDAVDAKVGFNVSMLLLHSCYIGLWHRSTIHDLLGSTSANTRESWKVLRQ